MKLKKIEEVVMPVKQIERESEIERERRREGEIGDSSEETPKL